MAKQARAKAKPATAKQEEAKQEDRARREKLANKYRPRNWGEVIGQNVQVKQLQRIVEKGGADCFLFIGPSGCGKTTLARIAARELGVTSIGLIEVDAATNTGIEKMRELQEPLNYRSFGGGGRAVIIDECHALSKAAWQSLLKSTEEPNPDVYWFFCTTEPGKVPATIKTRAATFTLTSVSDRELGALFDEICELEKLDPPGDVADMIIREAHGSPRQMLTNLAVCDGIESAKEAAALLQTIAELDTAIELCRYLVKGGSWASAMAIVARMGDDVNPEGIRIVVCNYMASCIKGARAEKEVPRFLNILDAFAVPYNQSEKMAPLYLSLGRILFS